MSKGRKSTSLLQDKSFIPDNGDEFPSFSPPFKGWDKVSVSANQTKFQNIALEELVGDEESDNEECSFFFDPSLGKQSNEHDPSQKHIKKLVGRFRQKSHANQDRQRF